MKDQKGFTLVELLGALVLVLLISYITFSVIVERMSETTDELDSAVLSVIYTSTADYVTENINYFPKSEGKIYCVTLQKLVDEDKLKISLVNPTTGDPIDPAKEVKITVTSNKYNYLLVEGSECTPN